MTMKQLVPVTLCVAAVVTVLSAWGAPRTPHRTDVGLPNHADLYQTVDSYIIHDAGREFRQGLRCLALNIYWEARSEPLAGQVAVAAVTLNRVADPRFPDELCAVVRQGGEARRHRCQFSWWCDGKKDEPLEADAWRRATTLARIAAAGIVDDPTEGALWYHADYVSPSWAKSKQRVAEIGRHIFYTEPSMETASLDEGVRR